jgi:glycosyltransferase involved in cell wall biosynthesis
MKIFMMIHGFQTGGAERNLVSLLPWLTTVGADVRLCTLNKRRDGPLVKVIEGLGIDRFDLGARRIADLPALRRLHKILRTDHFDVVHTQDPYSAIMASATGVTAHVPVVMTRHVLADPDGSTATVFRRRLLHLVSRLALSRVIAVSEAVRQRFAQEALMPLSRIDTVFNGIDAYGFAAGGQREDIRRRLGWAHEDKVVVMVAVMRGGKGHEILLDAMPKLRAIVPGVRAVIVGDGPEAPRIREMAMPLGDAVMFLGERGDVGDILTASDVLVLPSWSEALPNALIEAGAAGLPSVATNVGGTSEILIEGETGFLIRPGDTDALALRCGQLLGDAALARRIGDCARSRIEAEFSLASQARKTLSVYEKAVEQ